MIYPESYHHYKHLDLYEDVVLPVMWLTTTFVVVGCGWFLWQ